MVLLSLFGKMLRERFDHIQSNQLITYYQFPNLILYNL